MKIPWKSHENPIFNSSNLVFSRFFQRLAEIHAVVGFSKALQQEVQNPGDNETTKSAPEIALNEGGKHGDMDTNVYVYIYIYYCVYYTYHEYIPHSKTHKWMGIEFGSLRSFMGISSSNNGIQPTNSIFSHRPISRHRDIPCVFQYHGMLFQLTNKPIRETKLKYWSDILG